MFLLQTINPSIFRENELNSRFFEAGAVMRTVQYNLPVFILLFVCCTLAVRIYLLYPKKNIQLWSVVLSYGTLQQAKRDGHTLFRSFSITLFLIYMICGGIFFSQVAVHQGWFKKIPSNLLMPLCISSIGILILLRTFFTRVLGLLLKEKTASEDGIFQFAFNTYAGAFFLLVVCLLLHYTRIPSEYLFYSAFVFFSFLYVLRMAKIVGHGYLRYQFSIFHLILYLCAFEIIPLAIFIKVLTHN
ncbi:MAG: DUF4271 domain-containing protein [Bacteroidetes bacterium]|nr:DUF4271 domain-containing protein [Bacteroidota bacterium]